MSYVPSREGKIPFVTTRTDTPCETYYKIFGNLNSGRPPVVVLHGGPGSGHEYCLPFSELWSAHGTPVVFYDQIGCASSTHLRHTGGDSSFWQPDLFLEELENLLHYFNLDDENGPGFHVLGHSWGGVLAAIFASRQPRGLRRLILAGAPAKGQLFLDGIWQLKKQLSAPAQSAIEHAVQIRNFTGSEYLSAMQEFLRTFLCRADPWPPAELAIDFRNQADDNTVRSTIQGSSPWIFDGVLGKIDLIPLLPQIKVPTLVLNGEFDTTQYDPTVPFFDHIPKVRWVTLAGASHMAHLDSPELRNKVAALIDGFIQPAM